MSIRSDVLRGKCGVRNQQDGKTGLVVWFSIPNYSDDKSYLCKEDDSRESESYSMINVHDKERINTNANESADNNIIRSNNDRLVHNDQDDETRQEIDVSMLVSRDALCLQASTDISSKKSKISVLVVDDSGAIRKVIERILTNDNYYVSA